MNSWPEWVGFEKGEKNTAEIHFQSIVRKYPTYEEAKTASAYLEKLKNGEEDAAEKEVEKEAERETGEEIGGKVEEKAKPGSPG